MTFIIIAITAILALAIAVGATYMIEAYRHRHDETWTDSVQTSGADCATCSGVNEKCEQECMLEAAVQDVEYFDDEELDTFKGRPSDSYDDTEIEMFSNVLYTMKPNEVKEWNRSLILRNINLPDALKDEVILMINGE